METTTCFALYWPSSGCLGNLRASYMHALAQGVVIKYTSVIKLCLTTYLFLWVTILQNTENINYTQINWGGCSSAVKYESIFYPTPYKSLISKYILNYMEGEVSERPHSRSPLQGVFTKLFCSGCSNYSP